MSPSHQSISRRHRRATAPSQPASAGLSAITKAELFSGARHSTRVVTAFCQPYQCLPFDDLCAEPYGLIRADLLRRGEHVPPRDSVIAAPARAHDRILVTHHLRDFAPIVGLRLEDWEAESTHPPGDCTTSPPARRRRFFLRGTSDIGDSVQGPAARSTRRVRRPGRGWLPASLGAHIPGIQPEVPDADRTRTIVHRAAAGIWAGSRTRPRQVFPSPSSATNRLRTRTVRGFLRESGVVGCRRRHLRVRQEHEAHPLPPQERIVEAVKDDAPCPAQEIQLHLAFPPVRPFVAGKEFLETPVR